MSEPATGVDDVPVDVSAARKLLDEPLAVQQVDLPDFLPALSRRTDVDVMVDNVTTQWVETGCALDAVP